MSIRETVRIFVVLLPVTSLGCATSRPTTYISTHELGIPARSAQADQVWEAAQDTLRRHFFRIDRLDRRAGIVTTVPVMSQHFFEVWRKDVATSVDYWEAVISSSRISTR